MKGVNPGTENVMTARHHFSLHCSKQTLKLMSTRTGQSAVENPHNDRKKKKSHHLSDKSCQMKRQPIKSCQDKTNPHTHFLFVHIRFLTCIHCTSELGWRRLIRCTASAPFCSSLQARITSLPPAAKHAQKSVQSVQGRKAVS